MSEKHALGGLPAVALAEAGLLYLEPASAGFASCPLRSVSFALKSSVAAMTSPTWPQPSTLTGASFPAILSEADTRSYVEGAIEHARKSAPLFEGI
jgi:hypothetical protein